MTDILKSRPPNPFTITVETKLEDWKIWQKSYRCYAHSINLNQQSHDVQLTTLKSLIGSDALQIYNTFSIQDTTDVESVLEKFDEHFKAKANVTLERYKLYKLSQKNGQSFDDFYAEVTSLVEKCGFKSMSDEIVVYKIVGGISNEDVRSVLLLDENLNVDKAVQMCRASATRCLVSSDPKESLKQNKHTLIPKLSEQRGQGRKTPKCISKGLSLDGGNNENAIETPTIHTDTAMDVGPSCVGPKVTTPKTISTVFDKTFPRNKGLAVNCSNNSTDNVEIADQCESEISKVNSLGGVAKRPPSFSCDVCGKVFHRKRALSVHTMIHFSRGNFTCHYCGRQFRLKHYLMRHIMRSHAEILGTAPKIYDCDTCNYKTTIKQNMTRHKFQHTEDKPFSCQLCDYKCIVGQLMKAHMARHSGERPFSCDVCHKGFLENGSLRKHMVIHMTPEEKFHCSQSKQAQPTHKGPPGVLSCETCGKNFRSKATLRAHKVIHTGDRPYACNECDYRAVHRSSLITHKHTKHSVVRPFVCSVCGYTCKLKTSLQSHMNTHSGDRPYPCKLCNSKFRQSSHLATHMKTHTGEKPFVCDVCGHRWAERSNLKAHMKTHQNQSANASEQPPSRKRRKPKNPDPSVEQSAQLNAIPQWSEQVSSINPVECFPSLENTPFPHAYVQQGNQCPPEADCRFFEQRHWSHQNQATNPNSSSTVVVLMRPGVLNS